MLADYSNSINLSPKVLKPNPKYDAFFKDPALIDYLALKRSIENEGIRKPIIATEDLIVLSGHQRLRAAKDLDFINVPVSTILAADERIATPLLLIFSRNNLDNPNRLKSKASALVADLLLKYYKNCVFNDVEYTDEGANDYILRRLKKIVI